MSVTRRHAIKAPLQLLDHRNLVSYRNIWICEC